MTHPANEQDGSSLRGAKGGETVYFGEVLVLNGPAWTIRRHNDHGALVLVTVRCAGDIEINLYLDPASALSIAEHLADAAIGVPSGESST